MSPVTSKLLRIGSRQAIGAAGGNRAGIDLELAVQRDAAIEVVFGSADPVSVVLLFAAGADSTELQQRLASRRRAVAAQLESMTAERERLTGQGVLPALAIAAFRRGELRLDAELRWRDEFGAQLPARQR